MRRKSSEVPYDERATGIETTFGVSQVCAISAEVCANQRVIGRNANRSLCTIRANKRSSTVRFCPKRFGWQQTGREIGTFLHYLRDSDFSRALRVKFSADTPRSIDNSRKWKVTHNYLAKPPRARTRERYGWARLRPRMRHFFTSDRGLFSTSDYISAFSFEARRFAL